VILKELLDDAPLLLLFLLTIALMIVFIEIGYRLARLYDGKPRKPQMAQMSMLSMMIMGYQAGLTGTHSRLATWVLAITFSAVMMLVTDLDRPRVSLFKMDQRLMTELQNRID